MEEGKGKADIERELRNMEGLLHVNLRLHKQSNQSESLFSIFIEKGCSGVIHTIFCLSLPPLLSFLPSPPPSYLPPYF